jgi:predicted ATP-dependent endonuclease of OLD family
MVLCKLAENHQVIYTTHSDKMLDIFDTKWLIRIEFDENKWTQLKYNKANEKFEPILPELVTLENYNSYIKYIEPNLNKILFSKKVILVEWPNDLLVYYKLIEKKIFENIKENETILDKQKFCETYLNFKNISIIPHHWKATALFLTQLCQHLWLEYFLINDLDFNDENLIESLCKYNSEEEMKAWTEWTSESDSTKKWMITTNWKLINKAWKENIHFNIDKLETLIWYNSSDKNSYKIFEIINKNDFLITNKLFPENLEIFIELKEKQIVEENYKQEISIEEVPF